MTYPKRCEMSDDGKFYTHTDGSVFSINKSDTCVECFLRDECNLAKHFTGCRFAKCTVVAGAYVPSDEEQAACDMARAMIVKCGGPESTRCLYYGGGYLCDDITNKSCPARAYIAAHGDANAWETNG